MKKKMSFVLVLAMLAGVLTGCGGTQAKTEEPVTTKKQEVIMWGSMSGDAVNHMNQMVDKYNSEQELYHLTYAVQNGMEEKVLTAIASGDVPDIVMWDRFTTGTYAAKGAFLPMDEYVQKGNVDLSQFYEPTVNEMKGADGKLYGIPMTVDARIIFYNKDLLAAANVDPASLKTWDDIANAAVATTKRTSDGKLEQAGFVLSDPGLYNNWILQAGGKMIDTSATPPVTAFNSEEGLAVLQFWNRLLNEEKVYELGFEDSFGGNAFKAGKAAIGFNGPWALQELKDAGINYGVLEQPEGPAGVRSAIMGGFGLVIPSKAKNVDAAWDFIKWWTTNPENGKQFTELSGHLPANKIAASDDYFMKNEILSVFSKTMLYATTRVNVPGYSDVEGLALRPQLDLFVAGSLSASDALSTAQKQGDQILKDAAAK